MSNESNAKLIFSGIDVTTPSNANGGILKYSEMDNVLLAVDANDYLQHFKNHHVDLPEFLQLGEKELIEIGVDKVGLRKKMLDVIADMQKRQWEKSSVPKIQPRDKQNGIYLTAPDAALVIASISRQFKFLNANIEFLNRQIRDKPQLLSFGTDVATIVDIDKYTKEGRLHMNQLDKTLSRFEKTVTKQLNQDKNYPPDGAPKQSSNVVYYIAVTTVIILAFAILRV